MKKQKSYEVGLNISIINIAATKKLKKIKIENIIELQREECEDLDSIFQRLPKDKHGVYIVYDNTNCIYVGETKNSNGFFGRFQNHHYLTEFRTKARRIILYVIDKKYDNDRLLFEKLKIKELNPVLNKEENKKQSLMYTQDVFEYLRDITKTLIEELPNSEDLNINEDEDELVKIDKRIAKELSQVISMLEKIIPDSQENVEEKAFENEDGVDTLFINNPNFIDCPHCSGEKCDICLSTGKLKIERNSKCAKCKGSGFLNNGYYCDNCNKVGFTNYTPFETSDINNYDKQCNECGGNGKSVDDEVCKICNGSGYIIRKEIYEA
ncbi:hypothetical protein [Viridibacillus arvi]|uniref:hypothetical protein n=1 Tax=Viridibacillus arvi TaxID=263475 RepID=UPI0034CD26F4